MKNVKYILLAILAIGIVSCEEDPVDGIVSFTEQEVVSVPFSFTVTQTILGRNDFTSGVPVNVQLPASTASRELRLETPVSAGTQVQDIIFLDSERFSGEAVNLDTLVEFSSPTLAFNAQGTYTARVAGVRTLEEEIVDGDTTLVPSGTDEVSLESGFVDPPITFYDRVALNTDDALNVTVDWQIPSSNDLDAYIIDGAFTAILDGSETGSRYEAVSLDNTEDDGAYAIYLYIFNSDAETEITEAIEYNIFVALPDNTRQLISGSIPAGTITDNFVLVQNFTKAGTSYTFE